MGTRHQRSRWIGLWAVALVAAGPVRAAVIDDTIAMRDGAIHVRVAAVAPDVLRVTLAPPGAAAPPPSWVVDEALRSGDVGEAFAQPARPGFTTGLLNVEFDRDSGVLTVMDREGRLVSTDVADRSLEWREDEFTLRKRLQDGEGLYGLGDKTGALNRRGRTFVNWNTDTFGYSSGDDPIYKSIPFVISVGGSGGSYGIYLDNTWRSHFDLGQRDPATLAFGADGGPIDYYLFYGPTLKRVVERFSDIAGRAPLPPLWSFGYQQSKYSFMSATEVLAEATRLRAERIPADALWLDIDFQDHLRPFTVNRTAFPDLLGLTRRLAAERLHLVAVTDLHVARVEGAGYVPYDSGVAGDHFVARADGTAYVAKVWPGDCVFPDFTREATRAWWGTLFRPLVEAGIAGFWNDMNEPAIFETPSRTMPADVVHRVEAAATTARLASHAEIHNVYGMQNARATFEGLQRLQPGERPYVMTRAMFAGTQRYAVTWTGDNRGTWDHLRLSVPMILSLGLSGVAYAGADIGGFAGAPSPELLTRWIEIGAFLPVFRDHYGKGWPGHEPWVDGKMQLDIRRHFIEERYRLLPYWYALADEHARSGAPLVRPVFYEFEEARTAPCEQATTFLLGASLLVAPPPDLEAVGDYDVCLPSGGWYDYWTGRAVGVGATGPAMGAQQFKLTPALDTLPVYVRAGTILPRQPLVQSTADRPDGPLTLDVYPGPGCSGVVYLDDGHSLGYLRGQFLRQLVTCTEDAEGLSVDFAPREGSYQPWWRGVRVTVHDVPGLRPAGSRPVGAALGTAPRDATIDLVDPVAGLHLRFVRDAAPAAKAQL